jgi:hypothetical protein
VLGHDWRTSIRDRPRATDVGIELRSDAPSAALAAGVGARKDVDEAELPVLAGGGIRPREAERIAELRVMYPGAAWNLTLTSCAGTLASSATYVVPSKSSE